ncbi:MAG: type I-F CRISPR-associated protein Csy2 [Thiothrix sp.]|nr:MAG: type I-F CRISPR-associated protein Csy2 [Thiothrix sp.]
MKRYLLIKQLQVQNANALSSPFTYGFPAVTAFLGFSHALQRHLNRYVNQDAEAYFKKLIVSGVGIACHTLAMQDYQSQYESTLKLTANPLDKDGNRPSFVEEGRCHLTVSLVLELENLGNGLEDELVEAVADLLMGRMKLAGGDILPLRGISQQLMLIPNEKKSLRSLMPSYVLMERRDLMVEAMQSGQDALDALHGALQLNHTCTDLGEGKGQWQTSRTHKGWIVPIATGFHALTPASIAENQRDSSTPHRFAESVVTLGEFKMPIRCETVSEIIWRYQQDGDLYLCTQQVAETSI